ncbi:subclass B3 metallo-beta-lactamase [Granulicella sp. 5B5]|uniref:subclass B3 metallo-beta-lactamase n=1 Tax=Granulicella sp. 5B5 TaxID=1617967 RepID=UPI0015F53601|nr:subclass B3 metallo-beta-lactamase [Granulicella sp. 5B5]QMV18980.1 subclass B3 metallo-beta-lactamase [Granulicella sp. 5B5]
MRRLLTLIALLTIAPLLRAENPADWTTQLPPFQIADNLYYVGSRDLASYLITTPAGDILINANLASSPPQIRASVEKLGFHWTDIKIFLNGQAHSDHVGGAAEVLRETHAQNYVMDGDVAAMESGGHKDFAFGHDITTPFTPAHVDHILHDNERIILGGFTLTAHKTAGHTRGCTTFTFLVHVPGEPASQLRHVVIVGGWAPLSHYRLIDAPNHPASYPGIDPDFRHTFVILHALPCDIFLGAHGVYFNLLPKLQRMKTEGPRIFIDPTGYQTAVNEAQHDYQLMYAKQKAALSHE